MKDMIKSRSVQGMIVLTMSFSMTNAFAGSATIGIATAKGNFRVDQSMVAGNATLFEGASVETGSTTGELRLKGARVEMAAGTKGKVYQDHISLEQGKIQWSGGAAFHASSGNFNIIGNEAGSTALVVRKGSELQVASLAGSVSVVRPGGQLVLTVAAGTAYSFTPDPQGATAANPNQTVDKDDSTKKDDQDQDSDKEKKRKEAAAAAGAGGAAAGGTAAAVGMSTAATVAIVGGTAAAIAVPIAVVATRDSAVVSN